MRAPRPSPRSRPEPPPPAEPARLRVWWEHAREQARILTPPPGRLAILGGLAALSIGILAVLVERTRGGFDRHGLQRLAIETVPAAPPARPAGYLRR